MALSCLSVVIVSGGGGGGHGSMLFVRGDKRESGGKGCLHYLGRSLQHRRPSLPSNAVALVLFGADGRYSPQAHECL